MKNQPYDLYPETYIRLLEWIRAYAKEHTGNRLPSEAELASRFGVSRVKMRDVLSQLEGAGYITRKRGVGTLINRYVLDEPARLDIDSVYMDIVANCGFQPRSTLYQLRTLSDPPTEVAEKLALKPGESTYQIEIVVYADGQPVILVVDYIPARYYDRTNSSLSLVDMNIFLFLQGMCDDLLETLIVHMDACVAEGRLAEIMTVDEGYPLLKLDSVCYTQASDPVLYSVEHYNTKLIPFSFQKRVLSAKFKRTLPPEILRRDRAKKEVPVVSLTWHSGEKTGTIPVRVNTELMEAMRSAGLPLDFLCGGNHACGKCRVAVSGALSAPSDEEKALLEGAPAGVRLACFAKILGDCTLTLPSQGSDRIETGYSADTAPLDPIYNGALGAAFDIGTTTVVGYLFSREEKGALAVVGEMNRQSRYGADVLSRIDYANRNTVEPLRTLICGQLGDMLHQLCRDAKVEESQISGLCVTGNTTMLHLASGLDPRSLSLAPFRPQSLFGTTLALGLPGFPGLPAYLPYCISAYVGADITCSILASGILKQPGCLLLVDAGTNGEMALKTEQGLYCCATAAGPAFEGAGISCGSSARTGAISRVALDQGKLRCTVIGGGEAESLCGSGLIDAVACLLETGDISPRGRIRPELGGELTLSVNVRITQKDVRQLQLAKGAIRGGIDALLDAAGIEYGQLDGVILCGGFGSWMDPVSAERIGLLPDGLAGRTTAIGNAAGAGACRILQSASLSEETRQIAAAAEVVELSVSSFFRKRYIESMNFPPLC
ncbi:MAG: ASKHA domain-containing protein [Oscillospiraceae bacterium]|nr:ASKHA domain-containing protein [Oscillospiraceae bacterium]